MALKNQHTLLLVDDEKSITRALQRLFRKEGYNILTANSGPDGLDLLTSYNHPVSMIISDQRMPEMNGAQFLEKTKAFYPEAVRYLLTGYSDMDAVVQAVNQGEIHRYLTKPWNDEDLLLQVRQSLEHFELLAENQRLTELTIQQNQELNLLNKDLERKVEARTKEVVDKNKALKVIIRMLESSFKDSIRLLVSLVEILDSGLGKHMREVSRLARQVGETIGMSKTELDQLEMAGMIHDIGLLGHHESLWTKDLKQMTPEEADFFREHPVITSILLENVEKLADVGELVLHHHELVNGQGFPNGLRGDQIPLGSRILLAAADYCNTIAGWPRDMQKLMSKARRHFNADVWKAFTVSDDPEAIIEEAAEKLLLLGAGQKYDLKVVSALIQTINRKKNISPVYQIDLKNLEAGMVLMEDLRLTDGRLLLTRGSKLKESVIQSIQGVGERGLIADRISVSVPDNDPAKGQNRKEEGQKNDER